jgi:hypothetical protein
MTCSGHPAHLDQRLPPLALATSRRLVNYGCIAWRRLVKGPLRGFCTDELLALKPWIMQCTALISPCRAWCAPRAKLQDHDSTGRQKSDASGKARCAAVLQWCTASLADRFNRAVIVAIWRAPAP